MSSTYVINITRLVLAVVACAVVLFALQMPVIGTSGLGTALEPVRGYYSSARTVDNTPGELLLDALDDTVQVIFNERGVPQILANSDHDAIVTLGFLVARDRLFQLDFLPRVASGRLAEVLGPSALATDRFLRSTGMELGAVRNMRRIESENSIENDLAHWYAAGVNAHINSIAKEKLPLEFRLLGYEPDEFDAIDALRVLQYMNYDLSFRSEDRTLNQFQERGLVAEFTFLYPDFPKYSIPIVPDNYPSDRPTERDMLGTSEAVGAGSKPDDPRSRSVAQDLTIAGEYNALSSVANRLAAPDEWPGFVDGKGSNNWAVSGSRSTSGKPLLAGDMHLSLSLPSIWYEVGIHTPTMSLYGVTIPGAPIIVEGFNDSLAWAYTNSGADVVDRYELTLDSSGTTYLYEDEWRPIRFDVDTVLVLGQEAVLDTIRYTHHGPVSIIDGKTVATRWVGHEDNRILSALWMMNHSVDRQSFMTATRSWDAPTQNILYADAQGNVELRVTGHIPIRGSGSGAGILDGTSQNSDWIGRVPFDQLPYVNASTSSGFVTSTNQRSVGNDYPYYIGYSWNSVFRSNRINQLLNSEERHSSASFQRYQADVVSVQAQLLIPLLSGVSLNSKSQEQADIMLDWDRAMRIDSREALLFDLWIKELEASSWDEDIFGSINKPHLSRLISLAYDDPTSLWFDVVATAEREVAADILANSFQRAVEIHLSSSESGGQEHTWGDVHRVEFRHLTRSEQLRPFWRGPRPYPGYSETLSPGAGRTVVHSASWRMIVDFGTEPPTAVGIFPGGQSGNPLSRNYDNAIDPYLSFDYFPLKRLLSIADLNADYTVMRLIP